MTAGSQPADPDSISGARTFHIDGMALDTPSEFFHHSICFSKFSKAGINIAVLMRSGGFTNDCLTAVTLCISDLDSSRF